ncbi:hypothetical protein DICPUDRAFT_87252 [Dictyostelium purpureum]|uniref:Uncharacterized protein n=1 Tax=Dictyostelium purpureum TaxID=5786 RepID=F0ZGX8_DICPU|nr:uncharacterized protein DICPUDRAFT_87252 [Dictyostelium purpureum]EGC36790.1 hypothetical protein DICPUDRAFT_87252 [Dictyostelium purpureum]|eukprot:XP_003286661.1 hypothetical protein DICPUDRAFT_87252 [Dictyostelium purpureum]
MASNNTQQTINNKPQIKIFPSKLNKDNKNAIDWHWQNLVAYGCYSHVVIVDPFHLQVLQTLDEHRYNVSIVKWSNDISVSSTTYLSSNPQINIGSQSPPQGSQQSSPSQQAQQQAQQHNNLIRLASADINGHILIWSVLDANVLMYLPNTESNHRSSISDLCWHPDEPDLLLALHTNYISLWNVSSGVKIWKRDIPDGFSGYSIQFDPFKSTRVFLATSFGCIYSIDELTTNTIPHLDFKYRISSKNSTPIINRDLNQLSTQWTQILNSTSSGQLSSSSSQSAPTSSASSNTAHSQQQQHLDFIQMKFSPYNKNLIYFVLRREIFIYDSTTNQLFGSLVLDRNKSNFLKILLCRDNPNLMFTLHEDGSITSWSRRVDGYNSHNYDQLSVSDLSHYLKKSKKKNHQIYSCTNSPFFEQTILSISGDGILWKWDFISEITTNAASNLFAPRLSPLSPVPLNGVIKLSISGFNETVSSPNTSLSVYPFYNRASISLIAIGTVHGTIQIVNMSNLKVQKEIFVWNRPIYGIRWLSPGRVLCFSFEEPEKGNYINSITSVDFRSGRIKEFRKVSGPEPTPIRGIRLSFSRKFLIILFKDRPFELWETKKFTCLRSFKPFVHIVGLEWLPPREDSEVELSSDFSKYEAKEQFTFIMQDGTIKNCTIESNSVTLQDVHVDLGPLQSCFASKRDYLVSGDMGGTLHCWNSAKKKLHTFSTHRGPIKKIRFSPNASSNEILVLFSNGEFGIWDLNLNQRIAVGSYLLERDIRAIDFEWLTENNPMIVGSDHSLRVLDLSLSVTNSRFTFSSSIAQSIYSSDSNSGSGGYLYSPILLPTIQYLQLKNLLLNYRIFLYSDPLEERQDLNRSYDSTFIIKDNNEKNQKLLSLVDDKIISILSGQYNNEPQSQSQQEEEGEQEKNIRNSSSFIYKTSGISIAESILTVSQYFGDSKEIEFWRICISTLTRMKNRTQNNNLPFYNQDLIEFYDSLPCVPPIPVVETNTATNTTNSLSPQIQISNVNNSNIISPNPANTTPVLLTGNTNSNAINLNNIPPQQISTNTPSNSVSPSIQSSTPQPSNNAATTAASILKKPLASFFGFGQKTSSPQQTTQSSPQPSSQSVPQQQQQQPSQNQPQNISNNQQHSVAQSPPSTPSKGLNNILSPSTIFPILSVGNNTTPNPATTSTPNPLSMSQVFSSVASQLNQSTMDLGLSDASMNSGGSNTPSLYLSHDLNKSNCHPRGNQGQNYFHQNTLPNYYDIMLDPHSLRSIELDKADCYEKKRPDSELTKKLIEKNILLGRTPRAVNLLLDTTPDHPDFFNRAMKACVISASISPEYYQNTTKLIAENLIAVGKLDEGVQFLCLIGKTMEACKYLQSCDRWYDAAVLSKTNLSEEEHLVIFRAWIKHLLSTKQKQNIQQSINLLLSIGDFKSVVQILYDTQQYDIASFIIDCCLEYDILTIPSFDNNDDQDNQENDMVSSISLAMSSSLKISISSSTGSGNNISFKFNQLVQVIFKEYGNLLHQLGNFQAAQYYWKKAGKKDLNF